METPHTDDPADNFRARVAEHGRFRAIVESFAYLQPFSGMFGKTAPFYAESYWYALGGLTFLMFVFLTVSGIILAWLGPFWWLTSPVGQFLKSFHYWSAQGFFFFAILHAVRVWATGSFRGRRLLNWAIGLTIFALAMGENLFGLLARGDWESQFVSMHSDDMLFAQPFFFHLFSPADFTADLTIHIAVIPVVIIGLVFAHVLLVKLQGVSEPLGTSSNEETR